jgi:hypothetical protein
VLIALNGTVSSQAEPAFPAAAPCHIWPSPKSTPTFLCWVARFEGQVTDTSLVIGLSSLPLLLLQQTFRVVKVLIPEGAGHMFTMLPVVHRIMAKTPNAHVKWPCQKVVLLDHCTHSCATPLNPARSLRVNLLNPKVPFLAGEV